MAVSYTHLDVYKRQGMNFGDLEFDFRVLRKTNKEILLAVLQLISLKK